MRVGSLEETITVTGESPIVDVQSVRRQTTVTDEVITAIPMARSWAAMAVLVPSIATQAGAVINSAAVLTYNQTFSTALVSGPGSWRQPNSVLTPRFYKIGAQVDFLEACRSSRSRRSVAESAIGSRLRAPSSTALVRNISQPRPVERRDTPQESRKQIAVPCRAVGPGPVAGPDDASGSRGETE